MSATLDIDHLRIGMFIHLDLGWWQHPFALSSFMISSAEQIATIRALGLARVRWCPEKSRPNVLPHPHGLQPAAGGEAAAAPDVGEPHPVHGAAPRAAAVAPADRAAEAAAAARRAALAEQRAADRLCEQQYAEAGRAWEAAAGRVDAAPAEAREITEGLAQSMVSKMLVDSDMCIRVLADAQAGRAAAHALNVSVIALLMGRTFGMSASEMLDMGVGALLHDIGKSELPERLRHVDPDFTQAEHALYRDHVVRGMNQGQRMGLSDGAMQVLAQHHEMADGSGFPRRLNVDRMSVAARIVSLVNRYDNLCNPIQASRSMTPHEALSMIFAQSKTKFDASMLNAFIRMMGVYPPGSIVQLTDDRYATVISANSSRPLKPRVRVYDPSMPAGEALLLNLEDVSDLGIRRSVRAAQLPEAAHEYLSPRPRLVYHFEPVRAPVGELVEGIAA